jgi:hypothetical protein
MQTLETLMGYAAVPVMRLMGNRIRSGIAIVQSMKLRWYTRRKPCASTSRYDQCANSTQVGTGRDLLDFFLLPSWFG